MIFYESFYEAIKDLPDKERLACYDALIQYGIEGTVPDNLEGIPHMVFVLSRPLIDANRRRGAAGALGGRPKKKPADKEDAAEDEGSDPSESPPNSAMKKAAEEMFERLWAQYPSKRGEGRISEKKKLTLFKIGEDHMQRAIQRYIHEHEELEEQGGFVPQWQNGGTWFDTGYIDYLDGNYTGPPPDARQGKIVRNRFNNFKQRDYNHDELLRQIMSSQQMM